MYSTLFPQSKSLIGMIHLDPMPGYTNHPGMDEVIKKALSDLKTLEDVGFHGALVENDNDQPHTIGVSDENSNGFKTVMEELLKHASIPVGMEIIYDAEKTMQIAHEVHSPFIRLDVFVDGVNTKWGDIPALDEEIMLLKKQIQANDLMVFTDVQVKHATLLTPRPLSESVKESVSSGADALIITGEWTGTPPASEDCSIAKKGAPNTPILIGSGLTSENAPELLPLVDGAIIGTSIKTDKKVDFTKAKKLVDVVSNL